MAHPEHIRKKLAELPAKPGVYLMRDRNGKVIYVGKAKSLRNRVRNYFQASTVNRVDPKRRGLIKSIADFEVIVVKTEADALMTEARMIKEYQPYYNSYYKDDKRFIMLAVDVESPFPKVSFCRIQKNDNKAYFGPYVSSGAAYAAKEFVERHYGLRSCRPRTPDETTYKHCMDDIIRQCSAPCISKVTPLEYKDKVEEACAFLRGERREVIKELEVEMLAYAEAHDFEKAADLRDTISSLRKALKRKVLGIKRPEVFREEAKEGLIQIQDALRLPAPPKIIETFDISNISGTYAVASMVCAVDGVPQRNKYKRFKIKTVAGPDDPQMMAEAVGRRYKRLRDEGKALPDLVLVDGAITQLRAAREAVDALGLAELKIIGIAKRYEEIFWDITNMSPPVRFPLDSPAMHVLTRIRDEAHRFALTYHRKLREKQIRNSVLDEIPGLGEKKKELILQHFGSVSRLKKLSIEEISSVKGIGEKYATLIYQHLH